MKTQLLRGAIALVLGGCIASCSHDEVDYSTYVDSKLKAYQEVFVDAYGKIDPNQNWGFGTPLSATVDNSRLDVTRAISVNDDVYREFDFPSQQELSAAYPSSVPFGASGPEYLNDYNQLIANGEGHNYAITRAGEYTIGGGWQNLAYENGQTVVHPYNVYVSVNGNVTLKRNGNANFNLYILRGNVTLDSQFGEMGGCLISVARGATLNDQRNSIASNYGIKLFNRGTVNTGAYDIGNNAKVYNEAKFTATGALTYSAGAGNTSYFYNRGDNVELNAPSMTLNSTCHFFTDGNVNITGQTKVTQREIVWVNNGHYTTGSMVFSAKNGTFYNYCQLFVINNCNFTDGLFNMMQGSYAELGTGLFNNFRVNMYDNSGFNVKGGTKWGMQGADFDYEHKMQGFVAVNDLANVCVRLAGLNQVPAHKGSAFHVSGANLTLAYEEMKFYKTYNDVDMYSEFDDVTYSNETTAEELAYHQDEDVTWDLHNVTKIVTGADFSTINFSVEEGQCGATWQTINPDSQVIPIDQGQSSEDKVTVLTTIEHYETRELIEQGRVFCEDLGRISTNDLDFNDAVFDAYVYKVTPSTRTIIAEDGVVVSDQTVAGDPTYQTTIILLAAGGTLPLSVAGIEIHNVMGGSATNTIINTIEDSNSSYGNSWIKYDPVILGTDFNYSSIVAIPIRILYSTGASLELTAEQGWAPHKILTPIGTKWAKERVKVDAAYTDFHKYVEYSEDCWNQNYVEDNLYTHPKDNYRPRSKDAVTSLKSTEGPTTTYRDKGTSTTTGGYQGEEVLSRKNGNLYND